MLTLLKLPEPSLEQQEILKAFSAGYNIKVEAVAGAGKTTILLMCAKLAAEQSKRSIIVTFNKSLKDEINQKVVAIGLKPFIKVYTYHGAASKVYGTTVSNDLRFIASLDTPEQFPTALDSEIFMIDEAQDITDHIYNFLKNKVQDRQVIVVGDEKQCINAFRGAKAEYLTDCPNLFNTGKEWVSLPLRVSYRITPEMATFINNHLVNNEVLVGGNQSYIVNSGLVLPEYIVGTWSISSIVKAAINDFGTDQVAILTSSVKSVKSVKSPLGRLINSNNGINYYIMDPEQENVDDEIAKNKVLICSFNAMKGREKDCIILMGYDESYFKYFEKSWGNNSELPNVLYVAATRARKKLIIVQDSNENPLRTIKLELLNKHCKCNTVPSRNEVGVKIRVMPKDMQVTKLLKHRDVNDLHKLMKLVNIVKTGNFGVIAAPEFVIKFDDYSESVHKYYSKVIMMQLTDNKEIKEHMFANGMTIEKLEKIGEYKIEHQRRAIDERLVKLMSGSRNFKELTEIVVLLEARNHQYHLMNQISNYDWVNSDFISSVIDNIRKIIGEKGQFEVNGTPSRNGTFEVNGTSSRNGTFLVKISRKLEGCEFKGVVDYIDASGVMWLFKYNSSDFQEENNVLLLAGYLAILGGGQGKIYNVITGKITTIKLVDGNGFLKLLMK